MRNPNNIVSVDQNNTDYDIIKITNLEPVNEEVASEEVVENNAVVENSEAEVENTQSEEVTE